ncbi:hypothetical protein SDC9_178239 [bioreactor metagenome]|uniref:Uncharacterized protein n=1 Tax=bioreactor metagenome TaxID=1076179 RepID=A0A645GVD3_9ZZZZ
MASTKAGTDPLALTARATAASFALGKNSAVNKSLTRIVSPGFKPKVEFSMLTSSPTLTTSSSFKVCMATRPVRSLTVLAGGR